MIKSVIYFFLFLLKSSDRINTEKSQYLYLDIDFLRNLIEIDL